MEQPVKVATPLESVAVSDGSPEQASVPLPALVSMPGVTGPAVKASLLGGPGTAVAGSAPRPTPASAPTSTTVTEPMRDRRRRWRAIRGPATAGLSLLRVTWSPVDSRGPG